MKRTITIILFTLFFNNALFSQNTCIVQSFYLKIEHQTNVPSISTNIIENTITLIHSEQYITDIFSKYIIYGFDKAFPTATSESLKSIYNLRCSSKDLINELRSTVPNDVFFIENSYEGATISDDFINYFDFDKTYTLKEYISTSDAGSCTFDCDLVAVPIDFNLSVKISYDATNEVLVMENSEATSCGNSFIYKFKKEVNGLDNKLVLWEAISENPCFIAESSSICEVENLFFSTVLTNFDLFFILNEGSFKIKTPNQVFGENVFHFEDKTLSIEKEEIKKSISITANPIKDFIRLKINQKGVIISRVSIFDYSGKELIGVKKNPNLIDTSVLSSGIYFLQVETNKDSIINQKIIKE